MKSATIPSLRVDPDLRQAAESVLQEGETLSSFVEQSLRIGIDHRRAQQAFISRGLASRDEAERTGEYFMADGVLQELDQMIAKAQAKPGK
ncbi:MAG: YlcI/YnfO family protein [Thiobacillus sp.]